MKVFSLYSIKGGVGKTTAAVNLAYLNARDGRKTLLIDLDPQAAASFFFRMKPMKKQSSRIMASQKKRVSEFIRETDYENLDLIPSDISFRKLDVQFNKARHSKRQLEDTFGRLDREYDTLFVDCPPNITLLSENVFRVSDILLIPVIPTVLSRRTYEQVCEFLSKKEIHIEHVIPFFSMVDRRKNLHKELMDDLWNTCPEFLRNYVPCRSEIEKMGTFRAPLPAVHPTSSNSRGIEMMWREILDRVTS